MNKLYQKKLRENPLPLLSEDERIYFQEIPYTATSFAKYCHCGFDKDKKLWFTGCKNSYLYSLVKLYGVSDMTSDKARALLKVALADR